MSLLLDVPLGVTSPQILLEPVDVVSLAAAEEAIELADAYGVAGGFPLDESQRFTLRNSLGERADGSWAASTVCDFEPRQNGKNDTCAARELAGLILFGEQLQIHTAHEFATANESFLRLVAVFEAWDDLRKRVARIRYANGEQGIELLTGQRLKYKARTGGSGRGFAKADLVVYDEAQHLQGEHVAASGPARLANPNSQSWYMGSGGLSHSANAWRHRKRALSGERGRFAYVEHTAEVVRLVGGQAVSERPDVLDRAAWAVANPAYGRRFGDEGLLALLEEMGAELFARECMCMWDAEAGTESGVFPPGKWIDGRRDASTDSPASFGLDATWDREWFTVCWGVPGYVDVHKHGRGSGWVVEECRRLQGRYPGAAVWVHPKGPAGNLIADLRDADVRVMEIRSEDLPRACSDFYDDVCEGRLGHPGDSDLDAAVAGALTSGGADWVWDRKHGAVISPLYAATLARHGAQLPAGNSRVIVW